MVECVFLKQIVLKEQTKILEIKLMKNHHIGETILTQIPGLDLISTVPLDYKHLVLLGVVKKLLVGTWINGKPPNKLPSVLVNQISEQLLSFRQYIPKEFSFAPITQRS